MSAQLNGLKVLILVSNGVDEGVMSFVQRELVKAGAAAKTVSTESGLVNSWNNNAWGLYFPVDQQIGQTLGADFDALIVPSGARSIQKLGNNPHAERIVASFMQAGKPMAFIGDAVELIAKTKLADGWNIAGPSKLEVIMTAAGAKWQGEAETAHNMLMTGAATDVAAYVSAMIAHFVQCTQDVKVAA